MCRKLPSKPVDYIPVTRNSFPNSDEPVWQQVFSARHRRQITLNAVQTKDVDDDIHPLFNIANFSRLSAVVGLEQPTSTWLDPAHTIPDFWYVRMRPALALATKLLYYSSGFFDTILHGDIEERAIGGKQVRMVYDSHGVVPKAGFSSELNELSNIQFFFGHSNDNYDVAFGITMSQVYPKTQTPNMATVAIQLHNKFVTFFAHRHYDALPQAVKDRILVTLGITLVHELVHAWYAYKRFEIARKGGDELSSELCWNMSWNEPFFYNYERRHELGFSWEHFALGGRIDLYCGDEDLDITTRPMAAAESVALVGVEENSDLTKPLRIHPGLLRALLSRKCWDGYEVWFGGMGAAARLPSLGYLSVVGNNILHQVKAAIVIQTFWKTRGRLPQANELALELNNAEFVESIDGYNKVQKTPRSGRSISPSRPPTPLNDMDEHTKNTSLPKEVPLTPPLSPTSTSPSTSPSPTPSVEYTTPVSAWRSFAKADQQAALKSGYLWE